MPLGDTFVGSCCSTPGTPFAPSEFLQQDLCNRGYARGHCDRFPIDAPSDAVRFSITGDEAGRLRVLYIFEKDHAPIEHGALQFADALTGAEGRELLAAQAQAFLESYRRRAAILTPDS